MRQSVSSASPFEHSVGFSRAVRVGDQIFISGTAPLDEHGMTACPGDAEGQMRRCLEIVVKAVENLGGTARDVVRTRTFLTRAEDWQCAGRAHGEIFSEIRPASTMVVVAGLLNPDWLVKVEAEAIVQPGETTQ